MKDIKKFLLKYKFIKFNLVGIVNTIIDFGLFFILNNLFKVNLGVAQTVSFVCATANSYFMNKTWTFKAKKKSIDEMGRFLYLNICYLISSIALINLFKHILSIAPFFAKVIASLVLLPLNFAVTKLWVFRK